MTAAASIGLDVLANARTCTLFRLVALFGSDNVNVDFIQLRNKGLGSGLASVEGNLYGFGCNIHNAIFNTLLKGNHIENLLCATLAVEVGCEFHGLDIRLCRLLLCRN